MFDRKDMERSSRSSSPPSRSRRRLLRRLGAAGSLAVVPLSGCLFSDNDDSMPLVFSSQQGRVTRDQSTHIVTSPQGLRDAINTPDSIVWIPGDAKIDITNEFGSEIAPNVTIASNRGLSGKGGLLKCSSSTYINGHFTTQQTGTGTIRLSGIRLKGPRTDFFDPREQPKPETSYYSAGFRLSSKKAIVDNCEIFGWTNAGLLLGSKESPTISWVHHNQMHHNRMQTLGYPIELYNGYHLIEWNFFNHNRHSIAAFGYPTNGYEARFNLVGPDSVRHAFDMHALCENIDKLSCTNSPADVAGRTCNIHHNVFRVTDQSAFTLRGKPREPCRFVFNWCAMENDGGAGDLGGVVNFPDYAKVITEDNRYGKKAVTAGQEWLSKTASEVSASAPKQVASSSSSPTTQSKLNQLTLSAGNIDPLSGMDLTPIGT